MLLKENIYICEISDKGGRVSMDLLKLQERFYELYGKGDTSFFFSPSRINLIGEHIDYNGGKVLPGAIEIGTYGVVRKRDDNLLRLASENIDLKIEASIDDLRYVKEHGWGNYPKGVVHVMKEAGYKVFGMDILIYGNIPNGAGLSSSASLELLIAEMINVLFNEGKISKVELALLAQKAENQFVGVNCGIMDQFAIAMGRKNKAILLNTESLEYDYIDMDLKDNILVIMNTNKRRELSDSKYNERRAECDKALDIIKKEKHIEYLCQLNTEEFEELKILIKEENIRKRAEHAVYENDRVNKASSALINGEIEILGKLLKQSHESLRNLYEVTGIELDTIVDAANSYDNCLGARMTGAGFGGCAVAIVKKNFVDEFIDYVGEIYKEKIGYDAEFIVTGIDDGTRQIVIKESL